MSISSERSTKDQIKSVAYMNLFGEGGEGIRKANLMKDCLTQMRLERSLNKDLKAKISSALSTQKNALRNRFLNLLGYSMFSTRMTSKEVVSIALKKEYENEKREFNEKVLKTLKVLALTTDF